MRYIDTRILKDMAYELIGHGKRRYMYYSNRFKHGYVTRKPQGNLVKILGEFQ